MPYTIKWEKNGVVTTYHGVVNADEVLEADRSFYNDPRSDAARYQITDFTQGIPGVIDDKDINNIAAYDIGATYSIPSLKVALITNDPNVKSLCQKYINRMKEANDRWEFMIFQDRKDARKWVSK